MLALWHNLVAEIRRTDSDHTGQCSKLHYTLRFSLRELTMQCIPQGSMARRCVRAESQNDMQNIAFGLDTQKLDWKKYSIWRAGNAM